MGIHSVEITYYLITFEAVVAKGFLILIKELINVQVVQDFEENPTFQDFHILGHYVALSLR
jgi:hypothetical protein